MEPWGVPMHDVDYVKPWLKCNIARKQMIESGKVTDSSRSNKPTDFLNNEIIRIFKKILPVKDGYTFKTEKQIPCSRGGTFKVDVLVYKNNNLHAAVLLKAIQKSYNKNRQNYANTIEGEIARIKDLPAHDGVSVITIDWIPTQVPVGKKMEVTRIPDTSKAETRWNKLLNDGSFVSFNKIRFDLAGQNPYNIEGTQKLQEAIEKLKRKNNE